MFRLLGLRLQAAGRSQGSLLQLRLPIGSAAAAATYSLPLVRGRSSENSPSSQTYATNRGTSSQQPPHLVRTMVPADTLSGRREVTYRHDDVVRIAQKYRKLRDITDFDRLLPKFLKQKRFEEQQTLRSQSGTRRQLRLMGASAVRRRECEISGKRGVPHLHTYLAEDWEAPEESSSPLLPRRPWPPVAFPDNGSRWIRARKPLAVLQAPPPTRPPRIPLIVRLTTHHGAQNPPRGQGVSTLVQAPPMDGSLQPGLPSTFLPTEPAIQALERPLLRIQATASLGKGMPAPMDPEAEAVRDRRLRESSPSYVARVRQLLAAQTCPRVKQLGEIHLRKAAEKLDPALGVQRKSQTLGLSFDQAVDGAHSCDPIVSVGLFVRTGIKATHPVAAVRFLVKSKTKRAFTEALRRDFAAHGGAAARAQDRWQHWTFYIDPNPMVKLLPLERLVGLMLDALNDLDACRMRKESSVRLCLAAPAVPRNSATVPRKLVKMPEPPSLPGKKVRAEAERLGVPVEELVRRRALAVEEKARKKVLMREETDRRSEANRVKKLHQKQQQQYELPQSGRSAEEGLSVMNSEQPTDRPP